MKRPIDQVVHIKRVTRFTQDSDSQKGPVAVPGSSVAPKGPRPQPKGLKARYQPLGAPPAPMGKIGVDASSDSDEDVAMFQAPPLPGFGAPATSEAPKLGHKKRTHRTVEHSTLVQEGADSTSAMNSKKARTEVNGGSESITTDSSARKVTKQTPIVPPSVPTKNGASLSKARLPASSPVPTSALDKLPSTQPLPSSSVNGLKKVTPVLPPVIPGLKRP